MQLLFMCPRHKGNLGVENGIRKGFLATPPLFQTAQLVRTRTMNTNLRMPPFFIKFLTYHDIVYLCHLFRASKLTSSSISGMFHHFHLFSGIGFTCSYLHHKGLTYGPYLMLVLRNSSQESTPQWALGVFILYLSHLPSQWASLKD